MKILSILFVSFLITGCGISATDTKLSLKLTADILTLLSGNLFDIPIEFLQDVGNQLNNLDRIVHEEITCHNRRIKNTLKATVRNLQTFAECLILVTKRSSADLPISVNCVLQTIMDLLDPELLTVRHMKMILQKNFESQCAYLIKDIEDFKKTAKVCLQSHTISECVEQDGSDNVKEALHCII
ncbi:hypothetical protein RI129_008892 [Pyrocoelia pectoralis]|uniref:Uncharacterized protein n=1 Tax=Pyrocoelia pectoralis TaxID=417401 RepID=A0AAN7ZE47_9COLE